MPFPLLLFAALFAKAAIGNLVVASIAHSSSATLGHAATIAAHNVTGQAIATGTISGAAAVAAGAAEDAYDTATDVREYREKHGLDSEGRGITKSNGQSDEDTLLKFTRAMMSLYNKNQVHYDRDGTLKADISLIDACKDCSCTDYNDILQSHASVNAASHQCYCGHSWGRHSREDEDEWLYEKFAAEFYHKLDNIDNDGTRKTKLSQIDKCKHCDCPDIDRKSSYEKDTCRCDHGWASHARSPDDWH